MKVNSAKKRREHLYFELFRDICETAPSGFACAQERPDFLVNTGGTFVGVELTQYFKPTPDGRRPLQEQHALQSAVVDRARAIYEQQTGRRLRCRVLFRSGVSLKKRDVEVTAQWLAGFAADCTPDEDSTRRFPVRSRDEGGRLVTALFARCCSGRENALWQIVTAGWVRQMSPQDIEGVLASKHTSVRAYDERASENWLVIVLDGGAASFGRLTDEAKQQVYVTPFHQVHVFDVFEGTCCSLRVTRAA